MADPWSSIPSCAFLCTRESRSTALHKEAFTCESDVQASRPTFSFVVLYLRAVLDVDNGGPGHAFMDKEGYLVPADLVNCESGLGVLTAAQSAEPYIVMDDPVEHLDNLFNEDLCIYLWQIILQNYP